MNALWRLDYRHAATIPVTLPQGKLNDCNMIHTLTYKYAFWSLGFHGLHVLHIFGFLG
jgi:hypothetical protein